MKAIAIASAFVAFAFMGVGASSASAAQAPQPAGDTVAQECWTRGGGSGDKWNFHYCDRGPVSSKMLKTPDGNCHVGYYEWWRQRSFDLRIKTSEKWMCVDGWTQVNDGAYWDDANPICMRVFLQNQGGSYTEWGSAACG